MTKEESFNIIFCPNCKTELSTAYLSDARSGGHLFDVRIDFCEECLYIGDADCTNVSC